MKIITHFLALLVYIIIAANIADAQWVGIPANEVSAAWLSRNGQSMHSGLSGTLIDDVSGKPLAGVIVGVLDDSKNEMPKDYPRPYEVRTDSAGRFAFCLPPGQYLLEVRYEQGQSVPILMPNRGLPIFEVSQNHVLSLPETRVQKPAKNK